MKFVLMHPSRGRPQQALVTIKRTIATATGKHDIEYLLGLDEDDPKYSEYQWFYKQAAPELKQVRLVTQKTGGPVSIFNLMAKSATGDLYITATDSIGYPQKWDELFAELLTAHAGKPAVINVDDGDKRAHYWCNLFIFTPQYLALRDTAMPTGYHGYYADVDCYDEAVLRKVIVPAKHIKFTFDHYLNNGSFVRDGTYERGESRIPQDRAFYNARKALNFGVKE